MTIPSSSLARTFAAEHSTAYSSSAARIASPVPAAEGELDDRPAKRGPLPRVRAAPPERRAHAGEAGGGQLEPPDVQDVEGHPVALPDLAEDVLGWDPRPIQDHRTCRGALEAQLPFLRPDGDARGIALDEEGGEGLAIDLGVEREEIGESGVRDELLAPLEKEAAVGLTVRTRPDAEGVGAGLGLGEGVGADRRASYQAGKVPATLLLGADEYEGQCDDAAVGTDGPRARHGPAPRARDHLGAPEIEG